MSNSSVTANQLNQTNNLSALPVSVLPVLSPAHITNLPFSKSTKQLSQQIEDKLIELTSTVQHVVELTDIQHIEQQLNQINQLENTFSIFWGEFGHINATLQTDEVRQIHQNLLSQVTQYYTLKGQNQSLYHNVNTLVQSDTFKQYTTAQQRALTLLLLDFKLSGVALPLGERERFAAVSQQLSALNAQFANHVLDATRQFVLPLQSNDLAGLNDQQIQLLTQYGAQHHIDGPVATLDFPSYLLIMTYASNRALREQVYKAYVTRADDSQESFNNSPLIESILSLRHEMAQLLDYKNYAELSLATKMAPDVQSVIDFLEKVARAALVKADEDLIELKHYAYDFGIHQIEPWDTAFLSERVKQNKYQLSQDELKQYFPITQVLSGLFNIINQLFGVHIQQKQADVPHADMQYFEISRNNQTIAGFYLDLYARPNKQSGAWMSGFQPKLQFGQTQQLPLAFMVANFTPAVGSQPALLTHNELVTLFHEFGHGLHHLLTQVDVYGVSGIGGVEWDAVELPSQLMENWTWHYDSLKLLSKHVDTQQPIQQDLMRRLRAIKNFQSGLMNLRQVEFALFDMLIHSQDTPQNAMQVQHILNDVRAKWSKIAVPVYNRFQNTFTHIFAGGYAAGYYSYKWAEVLAADGFSRFAQQGVLSDQVGQAYLQQILAVGGSRPALESFESFMGRKPDTQALLVDQGLMTQ